MLFLINEDAIQRNTVGAYNVSRHFVLFIKEKQLTGTFYLLRRTTALVLVWSIAASRHSTVVKRLEPPFFLSQTLYWQHSSMGSDGDKVSSA